MATQNNTAVETVEKIASQYSSAITEWISADINNPARGLKVPEGYNWQNEIMSAMLYIAQNVKDRNGVPALQSCTKDSIMTSIRDMAIQGLSITRHHVYPIVYGNQLQMMESYFGKIFALKNLNPNLEIGTNVLYDGDEYSYCTDETGNYNYITDVKSSLANRDNPIVGAYGTIFDITTGKRIYGCVMTIKEIKQSWSHAKTDKVQKEFPQEMAKRTLINRMIKLYLNTTPNLNPDFVEAFNRSTENEFEPDDKLQNVTPPESEIEKQRMLHSKSKGAAGLSALLKGSTSQPKNDSEEVGHEITPSEEKNASEHEKHETETKLGREPSVKITSDGEVISNDAEENDPETFVDEDGNQTFIPF